MATNCFYCNHFNGYEDHGHVFGCAKRGIIDYPPHNCTLFEVNVPKVKVNMISDLDKMQREVEKRIQDFAKAAQLITLENFEEFHKQLIETTEVIKNELSAIQDALKGN